MDIGTQSYNGSGSSLAAASQPERNAAKPFQSLNRDRELNGVMYYIINNCHAKSCHPVKVQISENLSAKLLWPAPGAWHNKL